MEAITVRDLSFFYPEEKQPAIENVSFSIRSGEFVTLCGRSGSGKTTLLRLLKPSLSPHGEKNGSVIFFGKDISSLDHREESQRIGFVQQSPENQIVTDKVWHELAFGLENLGLENSVIRRRVAETAAFFGIEQWFEKSVFELSGGQKQILSLASIMAMQPDILILDEPASRLDPIATTEFFGCLSKINRELGVTVIITEHALDELLPLSDRVLVIDKGKIICDSSPRELGENLKDQDSGIFLSMPAPVRIWNAVDGTGECPLTVAEGRQWLEQFAKNNSLRELKPETKHDYSDITVSLKNVFFRYQKESNDVIKDLSLDFRAGEFTAILGGNGAGKTTLLSIISGINKPYSGKVKCFRKVGSLPQNPQSLFLKNTVYEDLGEVLDGSGLAKEEINRRVSSVASLCRLDKLLSRHPFDLSGGEQQRAALAKVLLLNPGVLLLDEPTKGFDAEFKLIFAGIIRRLTGSGVTVIMVSHDVEFCAAHAHNCVMLFNGDAVSSGSPREFFNSNSFYSTSANRMSKGIINSAITAEDVIYCCNVDLPDNNPDEGESTQAYDMPDDAEKSDENMDSSSQLSPLKKGLGIIGAAMLIAGIFINLDLFGMFDLGESYIQINILLIALPIVLLMFSFGAFSKSEGVKIDAVEGTKLRKRTVAAAVIIILAIPLTMFLGIKFLNDEKYMFISLLVMLEASLPFFLIFEGRKPQARELVILSALCALAIAGRAAFYMLPMFKPVLAVVIIAGVAFGGEAGFIVGAVTMLLSNMFFGQGPWTPWQMFAAGIIGFLAGILFKKGFLGRSRGALCVFGFVATILIYGPIMNFASFIMTRSPWDVKIIASFFVQGFPMDLIHAFSTLVFLFFAAEPMLEKLDRIKLKYSLYSPK